jgi:hypothetical protein
VARVHASSRARNLVLDRTQRAIAEPRPQGGRPWMTLALGVGLMLVVIAFTVSYQTLVRQIRDRDQTIASQTTEITQLQDEVQREAEILKVLQSRRIDVVAMNGLEVNPVGYGKIIWDPDRKVAILQVANLPAVPAGKDYQLWIIKNKDPHPVSAGVFAVANDREAQNYFKVQPLQIVDRSQITAFAVTLEPKGGMPQPTGAMYLMGKTAAD